MVDDDDLLRAIDAKLANAYGSDGNSFLALQRAKALEAYLGLNVNPAPEGRSQIVDRSVFETIQTMLPSLVRIFASSSDEVVRFVAVGPQDEQNADLTTAYLNHIVTQKNPWEQICSDWIHDSLLLMNGYAMAYWDDAEDTQRETYEGQTEDQVALLMQDDDLTILEQSSTQQMGVDPNTGQPMPVNLYTLVCDRVNKNGRLRLCVLPPEHCLVDADTPDWMLERASYFEYREMKTIAQLRAMGLDVEEGIGDSIAFDDTPEDLVRDRMSEHANIRREDGEGLMRRVVTRSIWIKVEDQGKERMYYVICVGREVLYKEPCGRIPVSSMTPQPMPHRHPGMSVAETVLDLQDVGTAITRGALDNLYLANNGRYAISNDVNLADMLDSRPGGLVRMADGSMALPAQGHIMPLTHPSMFGEIVQSLEYFDEKRQNRTGVSRYFSGTDAGALNKTASGIAQLTNAAAQRVEHIARMMAPAVEYLFSVCHELMLKHNNRSEMLKLKGQWTRIDPACWQTKRDVRISVGVGAGNRDSLLANLSMTLQEQIALAQSPLGIVKPQNIYKTELEKTKLMGYANPESFWTDPSQSPPQPQGPPPQMQVAMAQIQSDAQGKQMQTQADMQAKQMDAQAKMQIAKLQSDTQVYIAQLQSQTQQVLEQAKQQMAAAQMAMTQQQQAHEQRMSSFQAELDFLNQMQGQRDAQAQNLVSVTDGIRNATDAVTKLHEKIDGAKVVKVVKIKGPDGKMTGALVHHADGTVHEARMQ